MRPLDQLILAENSAWPFVCETASKVPGRALIHPPAETSPEALHRTQVTTRSPMGAIVYHSGGISIEEGWLRILGSGSPAIPRSLPDWNAGRSKHFYLIADDAVGGFFAIDGGGLGIEPGRVCYFSPRSLEWIPFDGGYTDFLIWACTDFGNFYDYLRPSDWRQAVENLGPDRCFFFYPPLWAKECSLESSRRGDVAVSETFDTQMDTVRQMNSSLPKPTSESPKSLIARSLLYAYKKIRRN